MRYISNKSDIYTILSSTAVSLSDRHQVMKPALEQLKTGLKTSSLIVGKFSLDYCVKAQHFAELTE